MAPSSGILVVVLLAGSASAAPTDPSLTKIRAPTDCWGGGWTPEICCSSPGAQGNPLRL